MGQTASRDAFSPAPGRTVPPISPPRRGLTALLLLATCLCLLEATKDPGAADQVPRPDTWLQAPIEPAEDAALVAEALRQVNSRGWVPRGEHPTTSVRRLPASQLDAYGFGVGPDFFPALDWPVAVVEFRGLIVRQHFGMVEYQPPYPMYGTIRLFFDVAEGRSFGWSVGPTRPPGEG
jgi:hypothetical protein